MAQTQEQIDADAAQQELRNWVDERLENIWEDSEEESSSDEEPYDSDSTVGYNSDFEGRKKAKNKRKPIKKRKKKTKRKHIKKRKKKTKKK